MGAAKEFLSGDEQPIGSCGAPSSIAPSSPRAAGSPGPGFSGDPLSPGSMVSAAAGSSAAAGAQFSSRGGGGKGGGALVQRLVQKIAGRGGSSKDGAEGAHAAPLAAGMAELASRRQQQGAAAAEVGDCGSKGGSDVPRRAGAGSPTKEQRIKAWLHDDAHPAPPAVQL